MNYFFKNIFSAATVFVSALFSAQLTSPAPGSYPQLYNNQASNAISDSKLLTPKDILDVQINAMANDPVLRNANWGFVVYDPKTKKIISSRNETAPLVPASTTKLLTTETAMNLLGEKFQWATQLEYSGSIDETGTLNGNLYIVGSGDPTMGSGKAGAESYSAISQDFISALNGKNIKRVTGNIILETAIFKDNKMPILPENIVWVERNNYYLPAGTTANINKNYEQYVVKQAKPFSDDNRYFYVSPSARRMAFAEKYEPLPLTTKIPDVSASLAKTFKAALTKSGIVILGTTITKTTDPQPEKRQFVWSYKSPTLQEVLYYTNQHSDNALAEATVRMVGFQKLGDQTLESGRSAVLEHLTASGFDVSGLNYMDGSGLSRMNTVTPIAQAKFLSSLINTKYFKSFQDTLPIAGQSGTLKKMFLYGATNGQIFAKTGTLNQVKCLAGYIKTRTGKLLTFSLLVNNYSGSVDMVKKKMETLLEPTMDL